MKKKRCLIFGANGFIANNFSKNRKIRSNFKVIDLPKTKLNLLDKKSIFKLKRIIKDEDYIFFAAGEAPAKNLEQLYNNIKILNNLIKSLKNKKIEYFLYISSDAVYKDTKKKINENSELKPNSIHGIMHLCREEMIKNLEIDKIGIFRPTLIFGPSDPHGGYGPNKFIRDVLNNKKIKLFGKGEELRDHIKIDSVVDIMVEAFLKKKKGQFNIATGKTFSFYKIAKKIEKKLQKNKFVKFKKRVGPLPHLGLRQFNITKIKKNFKGIKTIHIMNYLDKEDLNEYKKN